MKSEGLQKLYQKICKWLGLEIFRVYPGNQIKHKFWTEYEGKRYFIDFLNDYNQLQWIKKHLIELGCDLSYCYYSPEKIHSYLISDKYNEFFEAESDKSESFALLQAVIELIEKEK